MKWSLFNWKAPKQVDTSNFVTKDFLNTTLTNYVLSSSLNTTLSNYLTTNTNQLITGTKTFDTQVIFNRARFNLSGEVIFFKSDFTDRPFYMGWYNGSTRVGWLGKGSSTSNDITVQSNSNVVLSANSKIKLHSPTELGTEITAGYGGGEVKFIPEDNSTKTLKFYNANPGDTRRFNLLVPEPTAGNNPATKNYVDTTKNALDVSINSLNANYTNLNNRVNTAEQDINNLIQKRDYQWLSLSSTPSAYGEQFVYSLQVTSLQETTIVGVNVSFQDQANSQTKSVYWNVSWNTTWGPKLYIKLFIDKYIYNSFSNKTDINLDWSKITIRVFYIPKYNSRESEKVYEGEVVKLPEIQGGK